MPISDLNGLPAIAAEIYRIQPSRVIDLGIGFGLYGGICRQVLDGMYGRCRPEQWEREIVGVEGFEPYRNPQWGVYSSLIVADFRSMPIAGWDLVLMIDSLEHLDPDEGRGFLERIVAANRNVIVSVPVQYMPQEAVYGNELERHRTHHKGNEFDRYRPTVLHRGACLAISIKGNG